MTESKFFYELADGTILFWCPACDTHHGIKTPPWDIDIEKRTISPSVLVNNGNENYRCHLFVRDGKIQYLNDCKHEFAGRTIDMEYTSLSEKEAK